MLAMQEESMRREKEAKIREQEEARKQMVTHQDDL
jgi:hypothetical protein